MYASETSGPQGLEEDVEHKPSKASRSKGIAAGLVAIETTTPGQMQMGLLRMARLAGYPAEPPEGFLKGI